MGRLEVNTESTELVPNAERVNDREGSIRSGRNVSTRAYDL